MKKTHMVMLQRNRIGDTISVMNITKNQIARVQADWNTIAKEQITVEAIKGTLYGFGSELAVLRLAHKYTGTKTARVVNTLGRWCFALDVSL